MSHFKVTMLQVIHNVKFKCREHRNWFRHFKRLSSSRRSPNQRLLSSTLAIRSNVFKCPTSNERPNFYPPNILRSPSLPTRPPPLLLKELFCLHSFDFFSIVSSFNQDSTRSSLNPIIHFLFADFDRPETNQGGETFIPEEVSLAGMLIFSNKILVFSFFHRALL